MTQRNRSMDAKVAKAKAQRVEAARQRALSEEADYVRFKKVNDACDEAIAHCTITPEIIKPENRMPRNAYTLEGKNKARFKARRLGRKPHAPAKWKPFIKGACKVIRDGKAL